MRERERFRSFVFYGALILALGLCAALIAPFWRPIAWAVVLAILISPFHRRLAARMSPNVAAGLSCLLTIALVVMPAVILLLAVTGEAVSMAERFQAMAGHGAFPWTNRLEIRWLDRAWHWLGRYVDTSKLSIESVLAGSLRQVTTFLVTNVASIIGNLVRISLETSISTVTLFFILRDSPRLLPAIREFIPLDADQTDRVLRRAEDAVYATFYGVVVVAAIQGSIGGVAFWLLGLPSPLLWGLVMIGVCMIPLLGAPVVWVPAALSLVAHGDYVRASILTGVGLGLIGTVDNILRPIVIHGRAQLPMLIVFFSILGGMLVLGPVGLVLGPVLLTTTLVLLDILRLKLAASAAERDYRRRGEVEEEPVGVRG
jgi:predicted PurR-regulated permease PerM